MPDQISLQLDSLVHLDKNELCDLWKRLFDSAPPIRLRRDLMIPILGYRIQERAYGSLSSRAIRRLRELSRAIEADPNSAIISAPRIKGGTRLVRQWRNHVHVVNVEENGYEYKGSHYRSLSEIARLITGTKWSGPLFFGLKSKNGEESR
jgi:hypothetical protein